MSMSQFYRRHVAPEPALTEPGANEQAIQRVANRIFRRHLNEGNPISIEQAREDAERAMAYVVTAIEMQEAMK